MKMQKNDGLAPYACQPETSRGRLYEEAEHLYRSAYARDRDRIYHSSAFRRLQGKTQVFVVGEGDHFRTRLTHTLEVAQIARTLARALALNEDLAESIALAHDLGHAPFAHRGEDVLADCMKEYGGFDHNDQTVRVLTVLENTYPDWPGLNLTFETLEGVIKHNGPALEDGAGAEKLPFTTRALSALFDFELTQYATLEAQCVDLADDLAYLAHDVEDGVRAGCFSVKDLQDLSIFRDSIAEIEGGTSRDAPSFMRLLIRGQMNRMIDDVLTVSRQNLDQLKPQSPDDVRRAGRGMVKLSEGMFGQLRSLRSFLFENFYRHPKVWRKSFKAEHLLRQVFEAFLKDPMLLPRTWQQRFPEDKNEAGVARVTVDYLAGMTDAYLIDEHHRLFDFDRDFRSL
jgi:dGTPase